MFEHRRSPLLPARRFAWRLATFSALSLAIVASALGIGAAGYHALAGLPWIDALLNAAMILTGMGPVDRMQTDAAKLFATFYALFSGVAFVSTVAVLFAPVVHRFFHRLHLELDDEPGGGAESWLSATTPASSPRSPGPSVPAGPGRSSP